MLTVDESWLSSAKLISSLLPENLMLTPHKDNLYTHLDWIKNHYVLYDLSRGNMSKHLLTLDMSPITYEIRDPTQA